MSTTPPNHMQPGDASVRWKMPALVGTICAVVYLLTAGYSYASGDVAAANVLSWQIATTGNPIFEASTYPPIDQNFLRDIWVIEDADGRDVIGRSPGAVVAAVPAYLAFGRSEFSLIPGAITAAILTSLSAVLFALTLRDRLPRREAGLATLIFALSTPVWSVAANGMWPHTITVLGLCGMAWAARRERWWLVGLFGGVVLWGRLHAAVIIAVVGLLLGWHRREARLTCVVGIGSGLMLGLQGLWTKWIYGSWNPMSSYDTGPFEDYAVGHRIDVVNHLGFWVSPDRGLLIWSPLLLLLLPALIRNWRQLPDWSRSLLYGGLAYTLMQGVLNRFSGGDSFYGYRLTLELLACAAPALAFSAHRMGRLARILFAPVLALQTFTIGAGAVYGYLLAPVDQVWRTHALFSTLAHEPTMLVSFVAISAAVGVLGQRIWNQPRVTAKPGKSTVSAG